MGDRLVDALNLTGIFHSSGLMMAMLQKYPQHRLCDLRNASLNEAQPLLSRRGKAG